MMFPPVASRNSTATFDALTDLTPSFLSLESGVLRGDLVSVTAEVSLSVMPKVVLFRCDRFKMVDPDTELACAGWPDVIEVEPFWNRAYFDQPGKPVGENCKGLSVLAVSEVTVPVAGLFASPDMTISGPVNLHLEAFFSGQTVSRHSSTLTEGTTY